MPFVRVLPALVASLLFSGCGYIHFGRLPQRQMAPADAPIAEAYSALSTEHKILKQELTLARREGDALRAALDRGGANAAPELVARLNETTRELATLRASYAKLQAERGRTAGAGSDAAAQAQLSALEDKLAASLRDFTQLQEENSRLRLELDRTRTQNATLAEQLKSATAGQAEAQSALAQLNTELIAQKEARARAEQAASAVRAQLGTVLAASAGRTDASPAAARETPRDAATALRLAKAPPADASGTAELRTSPERLRAVETTPTPAPVSAPKRVHVVQAGDTLEKLAQRYYGAPEHWHRIYLANAARLASGGAVSAGMELEIPE